MPKFEELAGLNTVKSVLKDEVIKRLCLCEEKKIDTGEVPILLYGVRVRFKV